MQLRLLLPLLLLLLLPSGLVVMTQQPLHPLTYNTPLPPPPPSNSSLCSTPSLCRFKPSMHCAMTASTLRSCARFRQRHFVVLMLLMFDDCCADKLNS